MLAFSVRMPGFSGIYMMSGREGCVILSIPSTWTDSTFTTMHNIHNPFVLFNMLATNRRLPAHVFSKCIIWTIGFFLFATATLHITKAASKEVFDFQKGDIVAIYGNGLADRMQHAPWVETLLQNHLQGMDVRFRNMSFSGDTVDRKPRSLSLIHI